jgi:endonuclease YncB( thermonuclease family)
MLGRGRVWTLLIMTALLGAGVLFHDAPAQAQERHAATVTSVVDGDTLNAQVAGGPALEVQLIGIDAPEPGDCGGGEATGHLRQLALGRNVTLVSDPMLSQFESPESRPLFYVDRDDGLDVGLELVRAGWADIWSLSDFQRSSAYVSSAALAERSRLGVWGRCGGDFHFYRAAVLRERRRSAVSFMRRYYRRLSSNQFATAWGMLARRVRRELGPFASWKAGYRRSLRTTVASARARLSGRRAVVTVSLRAYDRDACNGRVVRQYFRIRWTLAPRRSSWLALRAVARRTGGGRPRLSTSECPRPDDGGGGGGGGGERRCTPGYSPCIRPGPDVDCRGGSGNGPRYVDGPVRVRGSDPYDLDSDGDGVGCQS